MTCSTGWRRAVGWRRRKAAAAGALAQGEQAEDGMAREREIKLRIEDLPALRRALAKVGAVVVTPRVHERNIVFDTPKLTLTKREQLLRIRTESPTGRGRAIRSRKLGNLKRPTVAAGSSDRGVRRKGREETELEVTGPRALARNFVGFGIRG